jgi:RNA polymerase sigma-70 factor (ECF subfamily)
MADGPQLAYSVRQERERWSTASDQELLEALRDDIEMALDELVSRKTGPLVQYVYRMVGNLEDARDVVQLVLVRVWENRQKYNPRYSPNTWIYRIATNLAIDHIRAHRAREKYSEPAGHFLLQMSGGAQKTHLGELQEKEVLRIFKDLSQELTEKQRTAFVLREVEGFTSQEVASVLGCRESTVRNHVFNARRLLKRELCHRFPEYCRSRSEERS